MKTFNCDFCEKEVSIKEKHSNGNLDHICKDVDLVDGYCHDCVYPTPDTLWWCNECDSKYVIK